MLQDRDGVAVPPGALEEPLEADTVDAIAAVAAAATNDPERRRERAGQLARHAAAMPAAMLPHRLPVARVNKQAHGFAVPTSVQSFGPLYFHQCVSLPLGPCTYTVAFL